MKRFMAPVAVGVVAAVAFGIWWVTTRHTATPEILEGWAMPNAGGAAISLHDNGDAASGNGYIIAGAAWVGRDNVWHEGASGPTCVGTDTSTRTRVRLAVVHAEPGEGIGGSLVVWLRCLD
ncbi:hypothetical protein [Amycolatopsis magusensis]|uniref:hypothetical protein n=1 Tax=Amycolatopsis magusensis TaxID=882444 RepID=UPI0037B0D02F